MYDKRWILDLILVDIERDSEGGSHVIVAWLGISGERGLVVKLNFLKLRYCDESRGA